MFASGRGSNLQAIIEACNHGRLDAEVVLVVSHNPLAGALGIARSNHIEPYCLEIKNNIEPASSQQSLLEAVVNAKVEVIALAGYMRKIAPPLLDKYHGKILNIHPALLPKSGGGGKFGGVGMYGMRVHRAVLEAGEKVSGASVHIVEGEYDTGRVLGQREVEVYRNDTAQDLADRVRQVEHQLYPETIAEFIKSIFLRGTTEQAGQIDGHSYSEASSGAFV